MSDVDQSTADELLLLEVRLLTPAVRQSPDELERLLADDFVEIGASGRQFDRRQIIEALQGEPPAELSLHDFRVVLLAPDVALATYRSARQTPGAARHSLRSSIWVRRADRWQLVFHQGTSQSAT